MKYQAHRLTTLAHALLGVGLAIVLVACQPRAVRPTPEPALTPALPLAGVQSPTPGERPTATPAQPVEVPAITGTPQNFAFTLTILHSGQVYGETEPCG